MKKFSNIKRLGVKSVHYANNTVIVEDHFSKNTNILFTAEYENIDDLKSCTNIDKTAENKGVRFTDLKNKNGFELSAMAQKQILKSRVNRVKKVSYTQELFDITTDNNIEVQIFSNLEDVKKVIAPYYNNVAYAINSLYRDISNDDSYGFDKIGSIPVDADWYNFLKDAPDKKEKWTTYIIPSYKKVIARFGIQMEKNQQVNFCKCLEYVAIRNGLFVKFKDEKVDPDKLLNKKIQEKLDKLISDKEVNDKLFELAKTPVSEFCAEANAIPLYRYAFIGQKGKRIEKIVLDKLEENEILSSLVRKIDENETTYNYLRLLSAIRQYVVHNSRKVRIDKNVFINDTAKRDVEEFAKQFQKNNYKYFCILKELYSDSDILEQFFDYTVFDEARNLKISIDKIKKGITANIDISADVEPDKLSEYANKFRTVTMFALTKYLKENVGEIEDFLANIKVCSSDEEKAGVYEQKAKEFITKFDSFKDIRSVVKKHLGTQKVNEKFDFYPSDINFGRDSNVFFNMLYVMSKFLTVNEARIMFQKIKSKYDSVKSLLKIAELTGVTLSDNLFDRFRMIFDKERVDEYQKQLIVLQSIRTRNGVSQEGFAKELKRIFDMFKKDDISYEEFEKELSLDENQNEIKNKSFKLKPLKSYLRNDVYKSKQYQYISSFASAGICQKIMENKDIVAFVLNGMLYQEGKLSMPMHKYVAKVYHDFRREKIDENSANYLLDQNQISSLVNSLCDLKLENIIEAIFKESRVNYKALVRLYLNICYLFVKNIISLNSTYLIQFQDYENIYKQLHLEDLMDITYDFGVLNNFVENAPNKKCRSYMQLQTLLEKDYIKDYIYTPEYQVLQDRYRNLVVHSSLLFGLDKIDFDFGEVQNISSYFAIYQTLVQRLVEQDAREVWGEKFDEYFALNNGKTYSTKLCIALNMPYAYNISRFNNNTIEKYSNKR
ncbi:MAG: hypothetical protein E7354_04685 [Clostridiales bacterium]|nr:hypothetical protein [Clostridiales bacterium]